MELAEINGESVSYPEFQSRVDELSEIYKMNSNKTSLDQETTEQIKEQTWQSVVRNLTMQDIYEDLGIGVSDDELFELVQGKNPHAIIQSIFILWSLFFHPDYVLFYVMILFGLVETFEEITLIFMFDNWVSDVKGIFWTKSDKRRNKKKSDLKWPMSWFIPFIINNFMFYWTFETTIAKKQTLNPNTHVY